MADYAISAGAEDDLVGIAAYTLETWGRARCDRYEVALTRCFEAIASGEARTRQPFPHRPEVVVCRCEHHFVFALRREKRPVVILAVLHEAMDLLARLRDRLG